MNLFKAATTVGGWTAISRILGMVREMLMSHYMGASIMSDAFVVAFKFPNFFRRFFAEGALNAAFVPQFSGKLLEDGSVAAKKMATDIFSIMAWFLFGFVLFIEVLTPFVIPVIAPGFSSTPERVELAITFTRITFPYILCISLTALLAGMLNSVDRFWAASAAPILLNIAMIFALLMIPYTKLPSGVLLSISVFIAGILQFAWLYWSCARHGLALSLHLPRLTDDVRRVLRQMLPGMVGAGVMQINLLIDLQLASLLPIGSMSYLYYADRLYQLPMSVFGVAIGTALLPSLSKLWRANDTDQALQLQNKALTFALFMNLPAAVGLIILSHPLISILFGHGRFSSADVAQTAPALAAFASGLPAYVAAKVFTTTFFATNDTKTPVKVAGFAILGNIILNLCLMPFLFHVGLALATSITAYGQVIALAILLHKRKLFTLTRSLIGFVVKITTLSIAMGLLIYITPTLVKYVHIPMIFHHYHDITFVLGGCAIGIGFYMASSYFTGAMKSMRG
jgi:putative peptidoglycan lipid II flippase